MLSLICPWHCSHRGTETEAACLSCHLKLLKVSFGVPCLGTRACMLGKHERLQIARSQKKLAWKAVAQPHLPMALLAQRHRHWGCLLVLPLKLQKHLRWSVPGACTIPAPKRQTSADSSQPESASLESCCSASSTHGTACTEAQRLGLLACLATLTSNVALGVHAGRLRQSCSENANVCR